MAQALNDEEEAGNEPKRSRRVVYCRLPGLLAHVASQSYCESIPLLVADGKAVRDVSEVATAYGVRVGQSVMQARRFCPAVLVVPLAQVEYQFALRSLLDVLAEVSPVVEPLEPDGAYADLSAFGGLAKLKVLRSRIETTLPFVSVVIGEGKSRLAARACAESNLPPERLGEASVRWLWPEDTAIAARLSRLGLTTFSAVAELPESFLVYQFGKVGRLIHQRARGNDLTPLKPLYPLPRVDIYRDFAQEPIDDKARFHAALRQLVHEASEQLQAQGRYGGRVRLWLQTEKEEYQREALLAAPVQEAAELITVAQRLSESMRLSASVERLRLLVEDLEIPAAITHSLFEEREAKTIVRLETMKRRLVARFGQRSLMSMRDIPVSVRDERRVLVREMRGNA